jgi:pyruvate ferredoxin oxidoreductase alpha subunit
VDDLRETGLRVGVLGLTCFRPFPADAIRAAIGHARRVIVLERAFEPGVGGIVTQNVVTAAPTAEVHTVVAGLGGRAITQDSLTRLLRADRLPPLTFLDLDHSLIDRELGRLAAARRSGPTAENLLRDLGAVASRIG